MNQNLQGGSPSNVQQTFQQAFQQLFGKRGVIQAELSQDGKQLAVIGDIQGWYQLASACGLALHIGGTGGQFWSEGGTAQPTQLQPATPTRVTRGKQTSGADTGAGSTKRAYVRQPKAAAAAPVGLTSAMVSGGVTEPLAGAGAAEPQISPLAAEAPRRGRPRGSTRGGTAADAS